MSDKAVDRLPRGQRALQVIKNQQEVLSKRVVDAKAKVAAAKAAQADAEKALEAYQEEIKQVFGLQQGSGA